MANSSLSQDGARRALDVLSQLRLRTAPHTGEARRLNTQLRAEFRLKRPADALAAWEVALEGEVGDELVHRAVFDWALALGLHAAINFEDPKATRRAIQGLARRISHLESRVDAIFSWSRRGRDVAEALAALVGRSPVVDALRTQTWRAVFTDDVRKALTLKAPHRLSVLITGEPGTGKEIVARTIAAGRGVIQPGGEEAPFVTVNIASLTPALASSDLFGHVRGAFTGATGHRPGLFAAADGGVLFLDEIGDASADVQVRLLRTLQEGTIRPVGADSEAQVSVRVLAATNRDLSTRNEGETPFRQDLLERLSVLRVLCPPLREREDDLPELVRHFVAQEIDLTAWPTIVDDVLERLLAETRGHRWPGNVRELRAATNRVLAGQPALLSQPGVTLEDADPSQPLEEGLIGRWGVLPLEELKHRYARAVLEQAKGNKSEAARLLGIDRNTLSRYVKKS
jgi:DNA-binding NtrC family response regulator